MTAAAFGAELILSDAESGRLFSFGGSATGSGVGFGVATMVAGVFLTGRFVLDRLFCPNAGVAATIHSKTRKMQILILID